MIWLHQFDTLNPWRYVTPEELRVIWLNPSRWAMYPQFCCETAQLLNPKKKPKGWIIPDDKQW
jgi:hypothetical protein